MSQIYGKPISLAEANQMATNVMAIKDKYHADIDTLTKNDPESHRFFCGGDALYVFSKDTLQLLLNRITQKEDCMIIFPASRKDELGRPTLMAFVYQLESDGQLHLIKDNTVGGNNDGTEHPGGNGSLALKRNSSSNTYEIPNTIDPSTIQFAFE